jgi:hypothetical protein
VELAVAEVRSEVGDFARAANITVPRPGFTARVVHSAAFAAAVEWADDQNATLAIPNVRVPSPQWVSCWWGLRALVLITGET